jgi:hypothetical protein
MIVPVQSTKRLVTRALPVGGALIAMALLNTASVAVPASCYAQQTAPSNAEHRYVIGVSGMT